MLPSIGKGLDITFELGFSKKLHLGSLGSQPTQEALSLHQNPHSDTSGSSY